MAFHQRKDTPLQQEFSRRGLMRHGEVMQALRINREALKWLVEQRQLREVKFDWKGHTRYGIPPGQIENRQAVYRGGVLRLIASDHPDYDPAWAPA
jgi:hypothetical protein